MQEFSSISASTLEPNALVGQLNERSAAGWDVTAIVTTGSTVTAYLSREAGPEAVADAATTTEATVAADTPTPQPATDAAAAVAAAEAAAAPEPATDEPFMPTAEPATGPATAAAPEPAPEPAAEPAAAAPAGWYADPSTRFELRYWDGSTWTEHVSRGGQQFTDPPVA